MLYTATIIIKTTTACSCSMPAHPAESPLSRRALMTPDHHLATGPRFLPPDSRPLLGSSAGGDAHAASPAVSCPLFVRSSAEKLADAASGQPDSRLFSGGSSAGGGDAPAVSAPVSCPHLEGGGVQTRYDHPTEPVSSPLLEGSAKGSTLLRGAPCCNRLFCVMRDAAAAETGFLNKGFLTHTSIAR